MKEHLTSLLICPNCKRQPQLTIFEKQTGAGLKEGPDGGAGEVLAGVLKCDSCSVVYPVIGGVPRFLAGGIKMFSEFVNAYRAELKEITDISTLDRKELDQNDENDYDNIRRSFSQEWSMFDYDADKTWGWTLDERLKVFLGDVCLKPEELRGRRMLDAGCGNGTLTAALSGFGLDILGLDLNDGLAHAYANRGKYAKEAIQQVQYVQGNVVQPPLKEAAFDLIYCSGVIHHTPSSKNTFCSLAQLTKRGAACMCGSMAGVRGLCSFSSGGGKA